MPRPFWDWTYTGAVVESDLRSRCLTSKEVRRMASSFDAREVLSDTPPVGLYGHSPSRHNRCPCGMRGRGFSKCGLPPEQELCRYRGDVESRQAFRRRDIAFDVSPGAREQGELMTPAPRLSPFSTANPIGTIFGSVGHGMWLAATSSPLFGAVICLLIVSVMARVYRAIRWAPIAAAGLDPVRRFSGVAVSYTH